MNKCGKTLPDGFVLHETIDLKKNKKQFWLVNGLSLALAAVCILAGWFIVDPVAAVNSAAESDYITGSILPVVVMVVGIALYIILHELTHGVFLGAFTRMKPKFGFIGWAAYCGNEGYCDKPRYAVVALAPLVFWGIVFAVLNVFFHEGIWFWCIWALQTVNVSGAAGDLFVTVRILRCPKGILVQDTGTVMKVFRAGTAEERAAIENEGEENQ